MALFENTLFGEIDRVAVAIARLKTFEPAEGYYLAFSGGKDSIVIKKLAEMSGVKYESHFHLTTVDPPELIKFIRQYHKDVKTDHPTFSMRQLIIEKGIPPTRQHRYCCAFLKEGRQSKQGDADRFVITGVRAGESYKRAGRRMVETCLKKKTRKYLNVIIDWSESDVWEFIEKYKLPYCKLYDEGFKRIGCIGCPLSNNQKMELDRYPHIKKMYLTAFDLMLKKRDERGIRRERNFTDAESVFKWFVGRGSKTGNPDQTVLFE